MMMLRHQEQYIERDIGVEQSKLSALSDLLHNGGTGNEMDLDACREKEQKDRDTVLDHGASALSQLKRAEQVVRRPEDELTGGLLDKMASFGIRDPGRLEDLWKNQVEVDSRLRSEISSKEAELMDSKRRLQEFRDKLYTLEIGVPAAKLQPSFKKTTTKMDEKRSNDTDTCSSDDDDEDSPSQSLCVDPLLDDAIPAGGSAEGQQLRKLEEAQRLMELKAKRSSERFNSFAVFQQEITQGLTHLAGKLSINVASTAMDEHKCLDVSRILEAIQIEMNDLAERDTTGTKGQDHARPASREGSPQFLHMINSKSPSGKNRPALTPALTIKSTHDYEHDTQINFEHGHTHDPVLSEDDKKTRRHTTVTAQPRTWRKGQAFFESTIHEDGTNDNAVLGRSDVKKNSAMKLGIDSRGHAGGKRGKRMGSPAGSSPSTRDDEVKGSPKQSTHHAEGEK
jgi:hypothetical protein